jgi:hypothetical protein
MCSVMLHQSKGGMSLAQAWSKAPAAKKVRMYVYAGMLSHE